MGDAGLQAGLVYPLSGADHLLAMIAVGMVSVVLGGPAVWRVPATFLLAMLAGAVVGYVGWHIRSWSSASRCPCFCSASP